MLKITIDDHLSLEPPELADAEQCLGLVRANLSHLQRWMPWAVDDYSLEHARTWIKSPAAGEAGGRANALIMLDGKIIGTIGYHDLDTVNRHAAIGYWIDKEHQGKGLMTRCSKAVIEHLFDELSLNRIQINCNVENTRSRAVAERLGFTLEGIAREAEFLNGRFCDWAIYSLLKSEWKSPDAR